MRRRFAMGAEAGFAVSLINKKLGAGDPLALHIEAVKEGEEPISFGPSSALVDYGSGWRLQTVTQLDSPDEFKQERSAKLPAPKRVLKPAISFTYIGKIPRHDASTTSSGVAIDSHLNTTNEFITDEVKEVLFCF
ncbi:hypothetical protein FF1_013756 [Malus domestica]